MNEDIFYYPFLIGPEKFLSVLGNYLNTHKYAPDNILRDMDVVLTCKHYVPGFLFICDYSARLNATEICYEKKPESNPQLGTGGIKHMKVEKAISFSFSSGAVVITTGLRDDLTATALLTKLVDYGKHFERISKNKEPEVSEGSYETTIDEAFKFKLPEQLRNIALSEGIALIPKSVRYENPKVEITSNRIMDSGKIYIPVWYLDADYAGSRYVFIVDGLEGKIIYSDIPKDREKVKNIRNLRMIFHGLVIAICIIVFLSVKAWLVLLCGLIIISLIELRIMQIFSGWKKVRQYHLQNILKKANQ